MANLSQAERDKMLEFLKNLKEHCHDESLSVINRIEQEIMFKKYGLVWEEHEEPAEVKMQTYIPVFTECKEREITGNSDAEDFNFILEGDNLYSLNLLRKTHKGKIDVIYIDPPYNRGKNNFRYNDDFVAEKDRYKHSKWLSFMEKRLNLAKDLLSDIGVIIINIDEHESYTLMCLLQEIFGEENNIGEIIWNKQNPKGDAKGISVMHETIFCFCKDRVSFFKNRRVCIRKKRNAEIMIHKAKKLFAKLGKKSIPEEVLSAIKPFDYSNDIKKDFYVTYDLQLINKEFQNWLSKQHFSNGEKAYKFIDDKGRIYRGVSMAWPNKKKAPDDYFIPLIHPVTHKPCPVPERGWRNSPATMKNLLESGCILFGSDETKQPQRKYYLDENMYENVPSIYENADSADDLLLKLGVEFEYPKPVSEAIYVCSCIQPNAKVFLDFFAGSGTTGQAILEMNRSDNGNRRFILCTNNDNRICENVTYPRMKAVITGKKKNGDRYSEGIPANLKYYRTDFIAKDSDRLHDELLAHTAEMLQLEYGIKVHGEDMDKFEKNTEDYFDFES